MRAEQFQGQRKGDLCWVPTFISVTIDASIKNHTFLQKKVMETFFFYYK